MDSFSYLDEWISLKREIMTENLFLLLIFVWKCIKDDVIH